jgi:tetratricopeptide (TPR) repeat protein
VVGLAISVLAIAVLLVAGLWWRGQSAGEQPTAGSEQVGLVVEPPTIDAAAVGETLLPEAEAGMLKREAVREAIRVAEAYPESALSYALLGSAYYNIGQSEEATRQLRRCLELNPGQAEAYEILGRIAYEKGELEEAVRLCKEALDRGPPNAAVLNQLGRALMDLGRMEEAIEVLGQAVRLPRPTGESHYLLGQALMQSGKHTDAKASFRRAIDLLPDHTQAFFGLYTASMRLGEMEAAERYRERFVELEAIDRQALTDRRAKEDTLTGLALVRSTAARTLFGAAQIYGFHDEPEKAGALFRRAAELDSETPVYGAALEAYYVQGNALAAGVATFQQLAVNNPESPWNHFFLGRLHERQQQVKAAERAYRRVQELAPGWAEGYRVLAELYLRSNLGTAEAVGLARKAAELDPSAAHHYLVAVASLRNQDRVGAREAIERAVALSPDDPRYQALFKELQSDP